MGYNYATPTLRVNNCFPPTANHNPFGPPVVIDPKGALPFMTQSVELLFFFNDVCFHFENETGEFTVDAMMLLMVIERLQ